MRLPENLRTLDDRVLGSRGRRQTETETVREDETGELPPEERTTVIEQTRGPRRPSGDGLPEVLSIVYRVSRVVFLALAAAVAIGIVFILAPTNPDNSIVSTVLNLAEDAAGPFKDVFTVSDDAERETVVNYGFGAVVYLVLGLLVSRLPGGKA